MPELNAVDSKPSILVDMAELQKVKDHNERLDKEIWALRDRVRSLDAERKTLLKMVSLNIFLFLSNEYVDKYSMIFFFLLQIENFKINNSDGDDTEAENAATRSLQVS